jgi:hypothetical protein
MEARMSSPLSAIGAKHLTRGNTDWVAGMRLSGGLVRGRGRRWRGGRARIWGLAL